ncbi:hypothetical protein V5O48_019613, partial [Marasmius crinis-equi]
TGETLNIAVYLNKGLMASVYFLTTKDEPKPGLRWSDVEVYVKQHDYHLVGKREDDDEPEAMEFLKLMWDIEKVIPKLYENKRDLVEEILREASSFSLALQKMPSTEICSASLVASKGVDIAAVLPASLKPASSNPKSSSFTTRNP